MELLLLCPRCTRRDQDPDADGFCRPCAQDRIVERYGTQDAQHAHVRGHAWQQRTDEARAFDRERQRRHRIRERIRPRSPAPYETDPWEIASKGLHHAGKLRGVARSAEAREHLEAVMETVRRLAWGPGD